MAERSRRPSPWLALVTALVALTAGCATDPTQGWTAQSTYRSDVATIAVPIAENDTFARGIEFELTDALIKEIGARTPYAVANQSGAQTVLLVQVREVRQPQLSKSAITALAEEMIVGLTIDFQWIDQRTETTLVERRRFAGSALFVPSQPSGERVELGRIAVVQKLARDVVGELEAAW